MIELTNETSYPQSLVRILQDNVPHLECCVNAVYNGSFQKDAVVDQVMEIISVSGFCGYHYSKCIPSEIRSEGLKLLNGQSHRDDFIRKYSNLFSFSDCEKIKSDWVDYYRSQHGREGKLWFIGNMVEPSNGNVSNLLKYFGGEAIYMGLLRDENTHILSALENIGKSCIIKILIKDIIYTSFRENAPAITLISDWLAKNNGGKELCLYDYFTNTPIHSDNIIEVVEL